MTQETDTKDDNTGPEAPDIDQKYMKAAVSADELLQALHALGNLAGEYKLHLEEDAIRSTVADPAQVAMVETEVNGVTWETDMTKCTIAVPAQEMTDAVGMGGSPPIVRLRLDDGEDELTVTSGSFMDEVLLIDPASVRDPPSLPDVEYTTELTVPAMKFKGAAGGVAGASSRDVRLTASDGELLAEGSEKHTDGYEYEWSIEAEVSGPEAQQVFSSGHLRDITDVIQPRGEVTVWLGDETPLRIVTANGLRFHCVPRIFSRPEDREEESS